MGRGRHFFLNWRNVVLSSLQSQCCDYKCFHCCLYIQCVKRFTLDKMKDIIDPQFSACMFLDRACVDMIDAIYVIIKQSHE